MENTFKIGEVVVCVDASKRWYKLGGLKQNEMYTIIGFNSYDGGLILEEAKSPGSGQHAYRAERFRKVDFNFADSILAEMVEPAVYELNAPQFDSSILN